MDYLIVGIASYLMGSVPFGFFLTKIFLKKDIRKIGSGNIGATNVLRTGNKIVGYLTLILDISKAILPEPIPLISFFIKIFVKINPNGIEPIKYEMIPIVKCSIIIF